MKGSSLALPLAFALVPDSKTLAQNQVDQVQRQAQRPEHFLPA
jgi:hypothetical protein